MDCEYDGTLLPERNGVPDACPTCEQDLLEHQRECWACRNAPTLPETINPNSLLEGLT